MKNKKILTKTYPYIAFVDLEMSNTSLGRKGKKEGQMLSMSAIIAEGKFPEFKVVDRFVGYACPAYFDNWNWHSEKNIHKISQAKAKTFPPCIDTLVRFLKFMVPYKNEDNSPIPFVYHGQHDLDYKLLEMTFKQLNIQDSFYKLFRNTHTISTYEMFCGLQEKQGFETENAQLSTVANFFNVNLNHHEVESDTKACYEIFKNMCRYLIGVEKCGQLTLK